MGKVIVKGIVCRNTTFVWKGKFCREEQNECSQCYFCNCPNWQECDSEVIRCSNEDRINSHCKKLGHYDSLEDTAWSENLLRSIPNELWEIPLRKC